MGEGEGNKMPFNLLDVDDHRLQIGSSQLLEKQNILTLMLDTLLL